MVCDLKIKMSRKGKATKTEYRFGLLVTAGKVVMSHACQVAVLGLSAGEPHTKSIFSLQMMAEVHLGKHRKISLTQQTELCDFCSSSIIVRAGEMAQLLRALAAPTW